MNQTKHIIFLFCLCFTFLMTIEAAAQTSRESDSKKVAVSKQTDFGQNKKASKKVYDKRHEQGMKDYEALMKANKKKYQKMEKGMKKPQYSDPTYFGHKKPPKKRKLSKKKFCKECGMIH